MFVARLRALRRHPHARFVRVRPLPTLEIVCWVTGLVLLAGYGITRTWADSERVSGVARFAEAKAAHSFRVPAAPDQTLWSVQRIAAYAAAGGTGGEDPVGVLRIARQRLEVPVYAQASERNLTRGVALISAHGVLGATGNIGIAGHRDGYFRVLKDVRLGDGVSIETLSGTLRYRVTQLSVVKPTESSVLAPAGEDAITLVTCFPFYFVGPAPERFIVRAVRLRD